LIYNPKQVTKCTSVHIYTFHENKTLSTPATEEKSHIETASFSTDVIAEETLTTLQFIDTKQYYVQ